MPMAIKLSNATTEQVANYLLLSIDTERGLRDAIALLETEKTFSGNPTLTNQMVLTIAEINSTLQRVSAQRQVFVAEQIAINPPDDEQVQKAKALASKLDKFIANGRIAKAVIAAATELVEVWTETRTDDD